MLTISVRLRMARSEKCESAPTVLLVHSLTHPLAPRSHFLPPLAYFAVSFLSCARTPSGLFSACCSASSPRSLLGHWDMPAIERKLDLDEKKPD
jgi:hypothetical protein